MGQGCKDRGHQAAVRQLQRAEGQNLAIEYRWALGRYDLLPELAKDPVRRQVNVIAVPSSTPASLAAKAATTTIPIIFSGSNDPVILGLVASLGRPGGNATGVNFFIAELAAKRLGLLHELVPGAARVAVLANPTDAIRTGSYVRDIEAAAHAIGMQIRVLNASSIGEIDAAFATTRAREPPPSQVSRTSSGRPSIASTSTRSVSKRC